MKKKFNVHFLKVIWNCFTIEFHLETNYQLLPELYVMSFSEDLMDCR